MYWPFMLRSSHELTVAALEVNLELRAEKIEEQSALIKQKNAEIAALTLTLETLSKQKCNDYTPEGTEKKKMMEPVYTGRGGWRTRAEMRSAATIPVTGDSAKQLEAKVQKEGGII